MTNPPTKNHAASRQQRKPNPPRVRLLMPLAEASALADALLSHTDDRDKQRVLDQLWLRTTLIEQSRRVRTTEREAFRERADRMLSALDP